MKHDPVVRVLLALLLLAVLGLLVRAGGGWGPSYHYEVRFLPDDGEWERLGPEGWDVVSARRAKSAVPVTGEDVWGYELIVRK